MLLNALITEELGNSFWHSRAADPSSTRMEDILPLLNDNGAITLTIIFPLRCDLSSCTVVL